MAATASITDVCVRHSLPEGEQVGCLFPSECKYKVGDQKESDLRETLLTKRCIIFGVPGAFTPVCSSKHVPSFLDHEKELRKHVDQIICTAVNDPFVLDHWRQTTVGPKSSEILFLADPLARMASALGLSQDLTDKGLGVRSVRYAMIVINGLIVWLGKDDDSFAEKCLTFLKAQGPYEAFKLAECEQKAREVLKNAHAPYHQTVAGAPNDEICGVAIHSDAGITVGTTVQTCAYPSSICGVRAAVCIALSEGATRFYGIVVAGRDYKAYPAICGQCKQSIEEFAPFPVVRINATTNQRKVDCCGHPSSTTGKIMDTEFNRGRTPELKADEVQGFKPADGNTSETLRKLYDAAIGACAVVYTPVSHFPVGAAFATDKGIFTGSNIELNSSIGSGLCAECVGVCKTVAGGARKIDMIALLCYKLTDEYGTPCGKCRQTLVEFGDIPIHMIKLNPTAKTYEVTISSSYKLLPDCFKPSALGM